MIFSPHAEHEFTPLNKFWQAPQPIINCVLDITFNNSLCYKEVIHQLDELQCKYLQIRIFSDFKLDMLWDLLNYTNGSTILSIELVISQTHNICSISLEKLCYAFPRVSNILVHSCLSNEDEINDSISSIPITYVPYVLTSKLYCGQILMSYFAMSRDVYLESLSHNSCLNRKIAIDPEGYIKNCPSMKESFGNIKDTTLAEAIEKPGFKKYWNITKDQIAVCKDCEFRYICTDCRAYVENPEDDFSKPLKCGYNPYTCEWEEWSTNPLKQIAIEHYGMQDLVKERQTMLAKKESEA